MLTAAAVVWQKLELDFELNLAVGPLFLSAGLEGLLVPGAAIEAETTTPQTLEPACSEKFVPLRTSFSWAESNFL